MIISSIEGKQRQSEWAMVLTDLEGLMAECVDLDAVAFEDNFVPPRRK